MSNVNYLLSPNLSNYLSSKDLCVPLQTPQSQILRTRDVAY